MHTFMTHYYCALHYKSEFVVQRTRSHLLELLDDTKKYLTEKSVALCYLSYCCDARDRRRNADRERERVKCDAINSACM